MNALGRSSMRRCAAAGAIRSIPPRRSAPHRRRRSDLRRRRWTLRRRRWMLRWRRLNKSWLAAAALERCRPVRMGRQPRTAAQSGGGSGNSSSGGQVGRASTQALRLRVVTIISSAASIVRCVGQLDTALRNLERTAGCCFVRGQRRLVHTLRNYIFRD